VTVISFREFVGLAEGDEGLRAFIDSQNRSFKAFLQNLLDAPKITDPRLVQEAQALIADEGQQFFNYGEELLRTDPEARATHPADEWQEWRDAILQELVNDLNHELAKDQGGKHWQARVRNLRWAVAIAEKHMAVPYQWRSMPEVLAEIPELRGVRRGGLQQTLKDLIDDARHRVVARMGSEKEQAVARRLRNPVRFREYVAAQEALLLPDQPARAGMAKINPFPATQKKLRRLLTPISAPAKARPIPSTLQSAEDGFAGYY
jgi:hypothetical protein